MEPAATPRISEEAFLAEVDFWASRLEVHPREVALRPLTGKWGSSTSDGLVTYDPRVLACPTSKRREIVLHELMHLKVGAHSRLFRSLLRAHLATAERN
jgi:predicted metal-dependent hydrolase